MSAAKPPEAEPDKKAPKPSRRRKGPLLMAVGVILWMGVGGGGVFWWQQHRGTPQASPEPAKHAEEVSGALPFEPFIVNLAGGSGSQYLKADIRLVVSGAESLKELEEDKVMMLRLRSAILEYLSQQSADALVTPEGKEALKQAIAGRCSKILGHAKVADVLFAEFVVQF